MEFPWRCNVDTIAMDLKVSWEMSVKIIQGLYKPSTGRVLLDGADIVQFTRSELADWIGYVPQESVLFAGSVRDNIAHRRPDADGEEIIKAATAAGVHHFIIDLPDGYATDIGEAGRRLSGGQRQRITVARALIGDPPVLLLDEPSSNLDRQAEQELRDTITELGRQRAVIVVTHSPILLAACDNLVALDKGKIALAGPGEGDPAAPVRGGAGHQTATGRQGETKCRRPTPPANPSCRAAHRAPSRRGRRLRAGRRIKRRLRPPVGPPSAPRRAAKAAAM